MLDHSARWGFACLSHDAGETVRVATSGELDLATAPQLDHALRAAQRLAENVTLDLRQLRFMDCSSLGVLNAAATRAGTSGGRFRVLREPGVVDRLFKLTGFDLRLELVDPPEARTPR